MQLHYLDTLFSPKSIAMFGASERQDSVGQVVFKNLRPPDLEKPLFF